MDAQTSLSLFHERLYQDLINILADLTDIQLEYAAPQIDNRCMRDVAIHAYRPVLAVACVLADDEWPVRPILPTATDELLQLLHCMRLSIDDRLARLAAPALEQTISLPWQQQQRGLDAMIDCLTHGLLHVGAIQGIRAFGGFPTPAENSVPPGGNR